jgi:Fic family protein
MAPNVDAYLADVEARYANDAYHSLSIEGYTVTAELIERVRSGTWNPDDPRDKDSRDAMAAKGYFDAHNAVRSSIARILSGENPGKVIRDDHRDWYRTLWSPSVQAGIIRAEDLAGYRNMPVRIRDATHAPPPHDAVRDLMPALFDLLENEEHPAVRAVLGQFVFVFIHPYLDGNGRLGRFLMNAMLASGGYPWTVITLDERDRYFQTLDRASAMSDIAPFAQFIGEQVRLQVSQLPRRL